MIKNIYIFKKKIYKLKMHFNYKLLILTLLVTVPYSFAEVNGKCSGRNGICIKTSSCINYGGSMYSGYCPSDPSNVKCCDNIPCTADDGRKGNCVFTDKCSGDKISGKCPGGSNFKCCVDADNYVGKSCKGVEGTCINVNNQGCSTKVVTGQCDGPSNIRCCLKKVDNTNPGTISTRFDGTKLSKAQFVSKVSSYCSSHSGEIAAEICSNLGTVYDTSKSANVNPELVITRAMAEGNSPGISKHNYWGMGCTNTGGYNACITYSSLQAGIKGFGDNVSKYENLAEMMGKYAYIGKYWYNPGSWSVGGCIYFPYIKKYMSTGRQSQVTSICSKTTTCTTSGGDCSLTSVEDQNAYASWQVNDKLGPYMCKVFGTCC